MKNLFVMLIAGIFVLSTFNILSQEFGDRDRDRDKIHEKLNLTEEQESQIQDLRINHQKEMIDLKAEFEKSQLELQELKSEGNYTRDEYLAKTEQIMNMKNKISMAKAMHQMDVYEMLDPSQKETWNDISKRFHKHKKEYRKHRNKPKFD